MAVLIHRIYNGCSMPEGMSGLQYALNTGVVTAIQPGTTLIIASTPSGAMATCSLRVMDWC